MDYIEELKKIRTELSNIEITHRKAPLYKALAYKSALEDFVKKEYDKFFYETIGNIPGINDIEKEWEPLKVDSGMKLRAMTDIRSLNSMDRIRVISLYKKSEANMNKIKEICGHANVDKTMKLYSNYLVDSKEEN